MRGLLLVLLIVFSAQAQAVKLEGQSVTLTDTTNFTLVNFQQTYDVVPAVFVIASEENPDPTTIRIRNVTTTGFEMAQVEPPGRNASGVTASMTVQYLAIEPGNHVLSDGTAVEVAFHSTTNNVYRRDAATYDSLSFSNSYSAAPVVLATLQTMNNETGVPPISNDVDPWITPTVRNVNSSSFEMILDRSEVSGGSISVNESVAWLAIANNLDSSIDAVSGPLAFLTRRANVDGGWGNRGSCDWVNFGSTLANPLVVAHQNTRNARDGGWVRRCNLESTRVGLVTDEDRDRDSERRHNTETMAFIAFADSFVYEGLPLSCQTWRDEFSSVSYSNNDGSETWSGPWVEQDSGGGGASGGQVRISGGSLRLQGNNAFPYASVNKITREADLSAYSTATLTFDYDASSGTIESDDEAWVQVSNDGGSTFTTLETFVGRSSGSRSYDISGFVAGNTQVRFLIAPDDNSGSCCYGASNEWFLVDDVQIQACGASLLLVDHYSISAATSALTCEPVSVTITAHDGSHLPVNPQNNTVVDLTTSSNEGLWTGRSVNNGAISYTFDGSTSAFTLSLFHARAATVNININGGLGDSGAAGEDPDIEFADTGLRFIDGSGNPIATQIAAKPSATYYLEAVRTDDVSQQCTTLFSSQTVPVAFAAECENPATCSGGLPLQLTYNGSSTLSVPTSDEDGSSGAASWSALQNLNFAADGRAPLELRYDDAGRVNLHAQLELTDTAGTATGELIDGSSNFLVRPAGLCVEARDMDGGGPRDPACLAGNGSCSAYWEAGLPFGLEVSAKAWVNDAETDSQFCDNNTTPNFQMGAITLTPTRVAPDPGVNGALAVVSSTISSGGEQLLSQSMNEVGVFTVTATPTVNYFTETIATSTSANIGRFIPHHFVLENPLVTPAAGILSYLDQPIDAAFDIRAANAAGITTQNYRDDFIKIDLDSDLSFGAVNDTGGTPQSLNSRISEGAVSFTWSGGEAIVALAPLTLERVSVVDGPFPDVEIGVVFADSDSITQLPAALDLDTDISGTDDRQLIHAGTLDFRYGRIFTPPVYGPEVPVAGTTPAPFTIQYWDGSAFVTNADDSASPYDGFIWTSGTNCFDLDGADSLDCTDTALTIAPAATVLNGEGSFTLARPGSSGALNMEVEVDPWFQFDWQSDWDNDGSVLDDINPFFELNFGSFRSHDRIIYWRERLR